MQVIVLVNHVYLNEKTSAFYFRCYNLMINAWIKGKKLFSV